MTFQNPNAPAILSAKLAAHLAERKALPEAFDAVFGEGAYLKLAGEVYDELRSQN